MKGTTSGIDATFVDLRQGYRFRIRYASKRSFLAAVSRSSGKSRLVDAVDHKTMEVVYPNTLEAYRKKA
jgi:hypothetical protein